MVENEKTDKYVVAWQEHISDLNRLALYLPSQKDRAELIAIKERLVILLHKAYEQKQQEEGASPSSTNEVFETVKGHVWTHKIKNGRCEHLDEASAKTCQERGE